MQQLVKIHRCPHGCIHLSIGAMTVRLDEESFLAVAQQIETAKRNLAFAKQTHASYAKGIQ